MEEGWVYVLVNSSVPGMAKVGRTTRAPAERAVELSSTGVATPFIVAYQLYLTDCHAGERAVHAELDRRGLRVAPNREFFRGAASEIIDVVLQAGEALGGPKPPDKALRRAENAAALLAAGDRALHGTGDTLQDTGEALRCYKLAIARGSAEACERLGSVFVQLYATSRTSVVRKRALTALKEGARRGNLFCYPALAELFALDNHRDNFQKAWRLFFTLAPAGGAAMAQACCRYIAQCQTLSAEPAHHAELLAASDAILAHLLARLPAERPNLAGVLRWVYAELLPQPRQGKAFFFEKKKQKTFFRLSRA